MQFRFILKLSLVATVVFGALCQLQSPAVAAPSGDSAAAPAQSLASIPAAPGFQSLTMTRPGAIAHAFPTVSRYAQMMAAASPRDTGPLVYHSGGPIMPYVRFYTIFWVPPTLQDGTATSVSTQYKNILNQLVSRYGYHGVDNNNTQYYQTVNSVTSYIQNYGVGAGSYTDTSAYPASTCNDQATGTNCIDDAQIQAEVSKVIAAKGWTGGLNNMYIVFTAPGEGSCFAANDSAGNCAYTGYCAYHGHITTSPQVIYANMPYSILQDCQNPGQPSPNGNAIADAETSTTSHEMTEAITDPELNAWYTAGGSEIGDLCAYNYGTNTWDSNKANEMWGGVYFELQMEWDNHANACEQIGPHS